MTRTAATAASSSRDEAAAAFGRLTACYMAQFAVLGIYMQFFPVWLHDVGGLSKADVTVVQSGQVCARTVAGPVWAQQVDRGGRPRRVLVQLALLSLLAFTLFPFGPGLAGLLACSALFGCVYPPIHPILDSFALRTAQRRGFAYTRVRAWGSASFLVVIVAVGALLERLPSAFVYWCLLALLLLALLATSRLVEESRDAAVGDDRRALRRLLRERRLLLLLLACGLVQGSHGAYYALSTLHWRGHGIGEGTAGLLWAEGVLAEIALFFWGRRLFEELRPTTLLVVGAGGAVLRWILLASTTDPLWIAAGNWLHAASFGCTYLGALRYVRLRIAEPLQATAQGLVGAATSGAGMVVGMLVAGAVYERAGGAAFLAMAGLAVLGGGAALVLRRRPAERGPVSGASGGATAAGST